MARGGEREAGLRARIEALLATLEKLGRCHCTYCYRLYPIQMDIEILPPFNIFLVGTLSCDNNSQATWLMISREPMGETFWASLPFENLKKDQKHYLFFLQGPHRLPWQVPPPLPGSDSQAGAALCWASKSPRRSPTCEQQHWHGREQEYKSKQQSWRSALRYLSLDLILLNWRRAVILIKTHPVILK